MVLADIENLLKLTIGLDAISIGSSAIERAVRDRMSACDLVDVDAYWERLQSSASELQELIEAVVVPETWFFRNREAFAALARMAQTEWLCAHPSGTLRLLSLPCATGEEPYSMAMTLADAGVPPHRFRIDAVDISASALLHARSAQYGKNSFRGNELGFRDRHFEATPPGYRLSDAVRQQVHFRQGNLFAGGLLFGTEPYDVIFCRNVLIYFDQASQRRAVDILARMLTARGLLFVGPSETGLLSHAFLPTKEPFAFAFRKTSVSARAARPAAAPVIKHRPERARSIPPLAALRPARLPAAQPTLAPPPRPPPASQDHIDAAARLADEGRITEATQACEQHVQQHGASATVFHLLGLLADAAGDPSAAAGNYRKALYLDPHHQDALIHLALLEEEQGHTKAAQTLRNRARRLELQSPGVA